MYLQPQSARLTAKAIARMAGYDIFIPFREVKSPRPWGWAEKGMMYDTHSMEGFATEEEAALDCCIKNGLIDNVTYESKETTNAPL